MKKQLKESEIREKFTKAMKGSENPKIRIDNKNLEDMPESCLEIPASCLVKKSIDMPLVWKDTDENWEKVELVNDLSEAESFVGKKKLLKNYDIEIQYI